MSQFTEYWRTLLDRDGLTLDNVRRVRTQVARDPALEAWQRAVLDEYLGAVLKGRGVDPSTSRRPLERV